MEVPVVSVVATERLCKPYQYDTLPGGQYFRYLILQPGTGHNPLQCSLETTRLAEIDYEAVSYVWGTETRQHEVSCAGRTLNITKNLHAALQRLRFPATIRKLWADSICINQQDATEKAHQVANMGLVYADARRVLVYMGPDPFHHAPQVSSLLEDMRRSFDSKLAKCETLTWGAIPYPAWDDPILLESRWHALEVFLHLTWFKRGWVVREVGLARECSVVWGEGTLDWTNLMWVAFWLDGRGVVIPSLPSSYRPLRAHMDAYWDRHSDTVRVFFASSSWAPNRLLDYIALGRRLQFKDRRDGLYAFFDLAQDSANELRLIADYSRSPREIYHRFAIQYLEITSDITLLDYISHDPPILRRNLPSWVPTWNAIETDEGINEATIRVAKPGLSPRSGLGRIPEIVNDELLKVHGVIWDSIDFVTEALEPSAITRELINSLWLRIHALRDRMAYASTLLAVTLLQTLTMALILGEVTLWYSCAEAYVLQLSELTTPAKGCQQTGDREHQKKLDYILDSIRNEAQNKKFFITKRGYMGLASPTACKGDLCGILFGCKYPCLLRPLEDSSYYEFMGATFVVSCRINTIEFSEEGIFYARNDAAEVVLYTSGDTGSGGATPSGHAEGVESRMPYLGLFGSEGHDEWLDWDLEEQDIHLC